jgi:hypothetical protein
VSLVGDDEGVGGRIGIFYWLVMLLKRGLKLIPFKIGILRNIYFQDQSLS